MAYKIHVAHYGNAKTGFRVYSCESYPSERHGIQLSGWHISSDDTLEAAMERAMKKIRYDWRAAGKPVPEVTNHGRQSKIDCESYYFARR